MTVLDGAGQDGRRVMLRNLALIVVLLAVLFPLYWMLSTAFKNDVVMTDLPPQWLPAPPTLDHFAKVLGPQPPFFRLLLNSLVVASGVSLLSTLVGTLAAYGLSRYPVFRSDSLLLLLLLAGQMFPAAMLVVPSFILLRDLHLLDTYLGLILANTSLALPFSIYMLKGFFDSLPRHLEEAARVDGCTRWQAMWKIAIPLSLPGIAVTAFMAFVIAWDDYVLALRLITSEEKRTLPVGIVSSFVGELTVKWGDMMAAATLMTIPVVLLFLLMQRALVEGLTAGAVKG